MTRPASEARYRNDAIQAVADIAIFIWAWVCTVAAGLGSCGGDGGSPYAAPGSPRGQACSVVGPGVFWVPIGLIALSWLPFVNTRMRIWMTIAAALFPPAVIVLLGSLSPECASGANTPSCLHY